MICAHELMPSMVEPGRCVACAVAAMPRSENLFCNLVTDEDSTTELLCNLMRFAAFRQPALSSLFGNPLAGEATFDQIETQSDLGGRGRADLIVRTEVFCGILEVKVTPWRGLTEKQERNYMAYLAGQPQSHRALAFLLPKSWSHLSALEEILTNCPPSFSSIGTHIAYWDEILDIIEAADLPSMSPIFSEVSSLFAARFKPVLVKFSFAEVSMLFNKNLPGALAKLDSILTEFQEKTSSFRPEPSARPKRFWPEDEYGFYFKNGSGNQALWFGIWMSFWQQTGYPLCFGVVNNWPAHVRDAFGRAYAGQTYQFERWTLGAVPQQTLMADAPVEAIWREIGPIIEAVTRASSEKA